MKKFSKKGIGLGGIFALVVAILFVGTFIPLYEEKGEWHTIFTGSLDDIAKADYSVPAGESGFVYICGVDDSETPATFFQTNRTSAQMSAHGSCHFMADSDNFDLEVPHTDPFHYAIKTVFNTTDSGDIRCRLVVSGDEAIDVWQDDGTDTDGDWVECTDDAGRMWGFFGMREMVRFS